MQTSKSIKYNFKESILMMFLGCLFFSAVSPAKNGQIGEIRIRGLLVAETCTVRPGDENIAVNFRSILDTDLYINKKPSSENFYIHLEDCDESVLKTVTVKFTGSENSNLPGLLAVDNGSMASGIGVEITELGGKKIPINSVTPAYKLQKGSNTLSFSANIQAEPKAITNKSIGLGNYTATSTFTLNYD
ncbi:fimbrial protein [Providencia sneebia]|uniref:Putative exported fimbrial protein n=1 Tax=Providencia sneebia DSM 19967 TaxID=1141660 RepID=K8WZE6_9GAMM|nr:fimbrial protein [Providencia sneebia]EKT61585.1 putative exported fimbrial protein [Providencia sneebia DSM 19967]